MRRFHLQFAAACLLVLPLTRAEEAGKAQTAAATTDLGDFGTDEPLDRTDLPKRGILTFMPKGGVMTPMDHWLQFDWTFTPKRTGHYLVRLTYELDHATLGVQLKLGETRLRKVLTASPAGRDTYLGEVFIPDTQPTGFAIYAPSSANSSGLDILKVELVPTHEGEGLVAQSADGSFTLQAKDATTWSEVMRYEPKPEKNCLGFWTDPEDFAEWELEVTKPGRFQIVVSHGCGGGNHGSEVAVKIGNQERKFTVEDTGGFQKWQDVVVGEVEIESAGTHRLVIDPVNKKKSAVLDVQKVILKPVG